MPSVDEVLKALSSDIPTVEVLEATDSKLSAKSQEIENTASRKRKGDHSNKKFDHKDKKAKTPTAPQKKYTLLEKVIFMLNFLD